MLRHSPQVEITKGKPIDAVCVHCFEMELVCCGVLIGTTHDFHFAIMSYMITVHKLKIWMNWKNSLAF